jgi:hypothetical protein
MFAEAERSSLLEKSKFHYGDSGQAEIKTYMETLFKEAERTIRHERPSELRHSIDDKDEIKMVIDAIPSATQST